MSDLRQAFVRSCAVTPLQARIGHDIGDFADRLFANLNSQGERSPVQQTERANHGK